MAAKLAKRTATSTAASGSCVSVADRKEAHSFPGTCSVERRAVWSLPIASDLVCTNVAQVSALPPKPQPSSHACRLTYKGTGILRSDPLLKLIKGGRR